MKKSLLAVFVLWFATLLLAGCMTNTSEKVPTDETVAEEAVVPVELEVVEPEEVEAMPEEGAVVVQPEEVETMPEDAE